MVVHAQKTHLKMSRIGLQDLFQQRETREGERRSESLHCTEQGARSTEQGTRSTEQGVREKWRENG